jgi:hypothetical protein
VENLRDQKLLFIAGLGHSGTTYLELLLCANQSTVGLGEVGLYLKRCAHGEIKHPKCSCGEDAEQCEFWSKIENPKESAESFSKVLQLAKHMFGSKVIVDSSKAFESFNRYYGAELTKDVDVKVIFLVRDHRSWTVSRVRNSKRKSTFNFGKLLEAYRWLWLNRRMEQALNRSGLPVLVVRYENLVFDQVDEMRRIYQFAEIGESFAAENIGTGTVHDIYGNRMKDDPKQIRTIRYDSGWMQDLVLQALWPLLIPQHLYMKHIMKRSGRS